MLRCLRLMCHAGKSLPTSVPYAPELPTIEGCQGLSWEVFREEAHRLVDRIADRHIKLAEHSEATRVGDVTAVKPGYLTTSRVGEALRSREGISTFSEVAEAVETLPGMVDWQHKNFLSFFPAQISPAALLGDMLATSYNHPGFAWVTNPASTEMEPLVCDAVCDALGLPPDLQHRTSRGGGGSIQPSATQGLLLAMAAARWRATDRAMRSTYVHEDPAKVLGKLVVYMSDQTHFSADKACRVFGVQHVRKLPTVLNIANANYVLDCTLLEAKMAEDLLHGLTPWFVVGNIGTTATCVVDPIRQLATLCRRLGVWLHVDAAYAGAAGLCKEHREWLWDGIADAGGSACGVDSITVNGSKWMMMNVGCSFFFTPHKALVTASMRSGGSYVPAVPGAADLRDMHLGMSKPWTSLRVFAVLRCVGVDAMANVIRRHMMLACYLDSKLRAHGAFAMEVKPKFGLVLFRVRFFSNEDNTRLQQRLMAERHIFVGTALVANITVLRISLAHVKLDYADMDRVYDGIVSALQDMERDATGTAHRLGL